MLKPTVATTTALLAIAFSLSVCFVSSAQDAKKTTLEVENARYAAELEAATKKINAYHLERLKVIQKNAVQAGDLDLALKVREEIKALETVKEDMKDEAVTDVSFLAGKWTFMVGGNKYNMSFDDKGRMAFAEWKNPVVSRQGKKITVDAKTSLLIENKNTLVVCVGGKPTADKFERVIEKK